MEPLTVSGTLSSLKEIAAYVLSAATTAGLDKKSAYKLRLAIDEIATNIILHGYEEAGLTGDITLTSQLNKTSFTITLEDSAIPYDPCQHDCPDEEDLSQELHQRPIGGLGVLLALDGVDEFSYEFVDNHNRNHFTTHLSKSMSAESASTEDHSASSSLKAPSPAGHPA